MRLTAVRVLREASEATGSGLDAAAAFALRSLGMLEAVQRALDVLKALALKYPQLPGSR